MNRRDFILGLPLLAAAPALALAGAQARDLAEIGVGRVPPGFAQGLLGTAASALAALERALHAAGHRERMPFAVAMEQAARLLDVLQREQPTLAVYAARVRADLDGAGRGREAQARLPGAHRWALAEVRLETPPPTDGTPRDLNYRVRAFPLDEALELVRVLHGPEGWYRAPWERALRLLNACLSHRVQLEGIPLTGADRAYYLTAMAWENWPAGRHFLRDAAAALDVTPGLEFLAGRLRRVARFPHSSPQSVRQLLDTLRRAARDRTARQVGQYLQGLG